MALKNLSDKLNFNLFGPKRLIGLSIGTRSVKGIEIKKEGKGYKLLSFSAVGLPEESLVNREIVNFEAVTHAVREVCNQLKAKGSSVAVGISGTSVIVKLLTLEVESMKELEDQVYFEAEQYLTFDPSELVLDFELLSKGKDNQAEVLVVGCKKAVLDAFVTVVEEAGMKPEFVIVDHFALQNAFEKNFAPNRDESYLVAEVSGSATKLVVVHNEAPIYTKDLTVGGDSLTQEIRKELGLNLDDAETIKSQISEGGVPQQVAQLVTRHTNLLTSEIRKAVDFFNSTTSHPPIGQIFLTGGGSQIPGLAEQVEQQSQLPTQILNSFSIVKTDSSTFDSGYLEKISPFAAVPFGLAVRMGEGA